MNTNNQQQTYKDVIPNRENIPLMIQAACYLLEMALFPVRFNNKQARASAQGFIKAFITKSPGSYANYAEFCQRILMARHYLNSNDGYQLYCSVSRWLDPEYKHGFAGTAPWFVTLKDKRTIKPLHLFELKAFPEAILELAEETTPEIFQYWSGWFLERKATDEQLVFFLVATRLYYGCETATGN